MVSFFVFVFAFVGDVDVFAASCVSFFAFCVFFALSVFYAFFVFVV